MATTKYVDRILIIMIDISLERYAYCTVRIYIYEVYKYNLMHLTLYFVFFKFCTHMIIPDTLSILRRYIYMIKS